MNMNAMLICIQHGRRCLYHVFLPANRIAEMDRKGMGWRKFKEINFVDLRYNRNTRYDSWRPVASGLNSRVRLLLE